MSGKSKKIKKTRLGVEQLEDRVTPNAGFGFRGPLFAPTPMPNPMLGMARSVAVSMPAAPRPASSTPSNPASAPVSSAPSVDSIPAGMQVVGGRLVQSNPTFSGTPSNSIPPSVGSIPAGMQVVGGRLVQSNPTFSGTPSNSIPPSVGSIPAGMQVVGGRLVQSNPTFSGTPSNSIPPSVGSVPAGMQVVGGRLVSGIQSGPPARPSIPIQIPTNPFFAQQNQTLTPDQQRILTNQGITGVTTLGDMFSRGRPDYSVPNNDAPPAQPLTGSLTSLENTSSSRFGVVASYHSLPGLGGGNTPMAMFSAQQLDDMERAAIANDLDGTHAGGVALDDSTGPSDDLIGGPPAGIETGDIAFTVTDDNDPPTSDGLHGTHVGSSTFGLDGPPAFDLDDGLPDSIAAGQVLNNGSFDAGDLRQAWQEYLRGQISRNPIREVRLANGQTMYTNELHSQFEPMPTADGLARSGAVGGSAGAATAPASPAGSPVRPPSIFEVFLGIGKSTVAPVASAFDYTRDRISNAFTFTGQPSTSPPRVAPVAPATPTVGTQIYLGLAQSAANNSLYEDPAYKIWYERNHDAIEAYQQNAMARIFNQAYRPILGDERTDRMFFGADVNNIHMLQRAIPGVVLMSGAAIADTPYALAMTGTGSGHFSVEPNVANGISAAGDVLTVGSIVVPLGRGLLARPGSVNTGVGVSLTPDSIPTGPTVPPALQELLGRLKPMPGRPNIMHAVTDDGSMVVVHKDFGINAHPIGSKYRSPVDHWNVEIRTPEPLIPGQKPRYSETPAANMHIIFDKSGNVIDIGISGSQATGPWATH